MNTVTFDTLKFVETLEQAGVDSAMASAVREAQDSALADHTSALATRSDVGMVKSDLASVKSDVASVKSEVTSLKSEVASVKEDLAGVKSDVALLRKDMEAMELRLNARMDALQNSLLIKLALFMVGLVGLVGALLKFFPQG